MAISIDILSIFPRPHEVGGRYTQQTVRAARRVAARALAIAYHAGMPAEVRAAVRDLADAAAAIRAVRPQDKYLRAADAIRAAQIVIERSRAAMECRRLPHMIAGRWPSRGCGPWMLYCGPWPASPSWARERRQWMEILNQ